MNGKVALVTGAGKRIGREVAMRLAKDGADVVVHYRSSETEAKELVKGIECLGCRSIAFRADLTRVEETRAMLASVTERFGRLDLLVNSAADFQHAAFDSTTEELWDSTLDANLKAVFFCCQAAAPLLRASKGSIVNFSDIGGIIGWPGYIPHCISKAGVIMLTRALAKELAPDVRVNAIAPGTITMPGDPAEWEADYIRRAPLKRSGTPDDVADSVVYLAGAGFVTGHVLIVDGGRTL
jgi:NAD(P)-dependent dehydrogenase (short-subunit alcohol dehydrogenase family)